jgi:hypothetical protein
VLGRRARDDRVGRHVFSSRSHCAPSIAPILIVAPMDDHHSGAKPRFATITTGTATMSGPPVAIDPVV